MAAHPNILVAGLDSLPQATGEVRLDEATFQSRTIMKPLEVLTLCTFGESLNVGTPAQLFWPPNYVSRENQDYVARKLSSQQIATLMHVDRSTVCDWRRRGWLTGHKTGTRKGWRKIVFWRHSLKDLEDCILRMQSKKRHQNPITDKTWTPQELETLTKGEQPEGRSPVACRVMRCRLRKQYE